MHSKLGSNSAQRACWFGDLPWSPFVNPWKSIMILSLNVWKCCQRNRNETKSEKCPLQQKMQCFYYLCYISCCLVQIINTSIRGPIILKVQSSTVCLHGNTFSIRFSVIPFISFIAKYIILQHATSLITRSTNVGQLIIITTAEKLPVWHHSSARHIRLTECYRSESCETHWNSSPSGH